MTKTIEELQAQRIAELNEDVKRLLEHNALYRKQFAELKAENNELDERNKTLERRLESSRKQFNDFLSLLKAYNPKL